MGMVKAADLRPGMVLSHPLRDLAGRTLLKQGTALTEQYIQRIRAWNFEDVAVEGAGEPEAPPPTIGYRVAGRPWQEVAAEIERRFSLPASHPFIPRLKAAIVARVKELAEAHARQQ